MDSRSVRFVAEACAGGQFCGPPETVVTRVCSDSRQAQAGDLFFALKGDRFDGHDFLADVTTRGVAAVVVERGRLPAIPAGSSVIAVDDPRQALGRLAARYRADFRLPVIAVGGSNGKTTTKELVAAVLRQKLNTLWSEASFNNDIGVPMTLLRLAAGHQAACSRSGHESPRRARAARAHDSARNWESSPASDASIWSSSGTLTAMSAKKAGSRSCCRRTAHCF